MSSKTTATIGGTYKQGDQGMAVYELQKRLNALGYRDAQGHALDADGEFGPRTRESVLSFQRVNGLDVDGVVGAYTLDSLKKAEQAPLLSNPCHPDHALFSQALAGVADLPKQSFKSEQERHNAAASLALDAKISGLVRIDHVLQSAHGLALFAIQGRLDDPAHYRIHVEKEQAATQPIARSTLQINEERRIEQQHQLLDREPRRIAM